MITSNAIWNKRIDLFGVRMKISNSLIPSYECIHPTRNAARCNNSPWCCYDSCSIRDDGNGHYSILSKPSPSIEYRVFWLDKHMNHSRDWISRSFSSPLFLGHKNVESQCTSFSEKSKCPTPWWILLVLMTSTAHLPHSFKFSSVRPPLTSTKKFFPCALSFISRRAGPTSLTWKLSSMTTSAPASMASSAWPEDWHSTSILVEKPPTARAAKTAREIEPEDQIWLSLIMVIALRSWRCGSQPPISIPYFSTSRKPGVVLRVPASVPW